MINTIIKVSGTILAGAVTDDIAAIDIPDDGIIRAIGGALYGIYATPATGSIQILSEISFLSTNQFGANDSRGTLAGLVVAGTILSTEGGYNLSEFGNIVFPDGIPINAGERIHLHGSSSAANLTAVASYLLYIQSKGAGSRTRFRR